MKTNNNLNMGSGYRKRFLLPMAMAVLSGPVFSQEGTPSDTGQAKQLTEVVVSASRSQKKIDDVGRSITVISSDDIKNSGANSLAELLSLAEGIYITGSQQNFGTNQSLFMRGANSNQSVVMIDGIAISDPSTPSSALDLSEIPLSDIDHVEVVRGSHSTLYGSSAIGGVVNIITNRKMKEGFNMKVTGTAGTFGEGTSMIGENAGLNYTHKKGLYGSVNVSNADVNGLDATIDTSTALPKVPRDRDGMFRSDYGVKAGFKNNRWDMFISRRNTEKKSSIDKRDFTDDDNYTLDFTRDLLSYGVSYGSDSSFSISMNGANSSMKRISLNDSSLVDNFGNYDHSYNKLIYTGETSNTDVQLGFRKKGFSLILGGGIDHQAMGQENYYYSGGFVFGDTLDFSMSTGSFFLLADINGSVFSEKAKAFSISLGARNNNNNIFGASSTYQVNPMFKVSSHTSLYANFSSGYNAPSLYQLYSPDKDFISFISRGNVNLRPETSQTQEFGVYHKLNEHSGMRFGYFQTITRDIIEYVYLWDKNTPVNQLSYLEYRGDTYMNLGTLRCDGVEIEAHGKIGKKFLLSGNFTYIKGRQHNSYESVDTVKSEGNHVQLYSSGGFVSVRDQNVSGLTRRPSTANISLTYTPTQKIFFKSIVRCVSGRQDVIYDQLLGPYGALGRTPLNAFVLVDLVSGIKFEYNLSALVRVENVFNTSYTEIRGFSTRGRGVYVSLNYTL